MAAGHVALDNIGHIDRHQLGTCLNRKQPEIDKPIVVILIYRMTYLAYLSGFLSHAPDCKLSDSKCNYPNIAILKVMYK